MRSALVSKPRGKQFLERTVTVLIFTKDELGVLSLRVHQERSVLLDDRYASTSVARHQEFHLLRFK